MRIALEKSTRSQTSAQIFAMLAVSAVHVYSRGKHWKKIGFASKFSSPIVVDRIGDKWEDDLLFFFLVVVAYVAALLPTRTAQS